jgi:PAS domain S-box-containing protein
VGRGLQPVLPIADCIGKLPEDVLPPDIAALARKVMAIVDSDGVSTGHEYEILVDGEPRVQQMSASRMSTVSDAGYVFLIRDVTDSRRQQRQVLRLGKVAELTSNLVVVTDAEDRIEWVNPAFEHRSGWRLDEVIGKTPKSFLRAGIVDRVARDLIRNCIREGREVRTELLNKSKSGEEYWTSLDISTLRDVDGTLTGFVGVQTDITEMKESYGRMLFDGMTAIEEANDGIALTDADCLFIYGSPAFRTLFGIGLTENIKALSVYDFYPKPLLGDELIIVRDKLAVDGVWRSDANAVLRDGTLVSHALSVSRRAAGGYILIAHDNRAQREAAKERAILHEDLEIAQRRGAIAELSSGVAHDLNNLIGVIEGTVDLIEMGASVSEEASKGLRRIRRAMGITRDLVANLARLDRPDTPRENLDLRDIARLSYEMLGTKRVEEQSVHLTIPDSQCPIWGNTTDVQLVLLNLVINACDAGKGKTNNVKLTVLPKGADHPSFLPSVGEIYPNRFYSFAVISDSGVGIKPEHQDKLFTRYFTTKGANGTGLVLPIIATILRDNDAVLWLESVPGKGTTATLGWPSKPLMIGADAPMFGRKNHKRSDLSGKRILVVDDELDMGQVLVEMLAAAGATSVLTTDPANALRLIRDETEHWAALVTDLDMPGLSGSDLAIVAAQRNLPLPVILVTAFAGGIGERTNLFFDILLKPTSAAQLVEVVSKAVSSR